MSYEVENSKERDIRYNRVSSSRFVFYITAGCILAFVLGGCFRLYKQHYKGKPDVEVPGNTKYTPEYK
ncbi:hypothetical protein [Filimonas effusa]|uniref:Uncharacterized protein n=1 Tax=Filimonas effusa TaxID=2508721 RepID=A0A4Q1DF68_9BACT|nr:hypothetical protein [Filimonas effusa]RXK87279.1 hypothetical protein ESB13_11005 [Filimonas effusa]